MIIQDLSENQKIEIEIMWGDKVFTIPSTVVGKQNTNVLLKPYSMNGTEIRVHENARDFMFNIYTIDPKTHFRVGWNDVELRSTEYKGVHYYICSTKNYLLYANDSERRNQIRTRINLTGTATEIENKKSHVVHIHDISATGIAFLASKDHEFEKIHLRIEFSEVINEEDYSFSIRAQIVRTDTMEDGRVLYGCKFLETPQDLLMYVFLKRSLERELVRE